MLHRSVLHFTLIFITIFACSKGDVALPERIKNIISTHDTCVCEPYIYKYKWRNQIIFAESVRGITCNSIPLYYDENGNDFTMDSSYRYDEFLAEAILIEKSWHCKE